MRRYAAILVVLSGLLSLSSCGKKSDADVVWDAQNCLNSATSATASQCVAMLNGITTPQAMNIICAAQFIAQGFDDPTRLQNAYSAITSSSGGQNTPVLTAMGVLAFTALANPADNSAIAETTAIQCAASGSPGLTLLSSLTVTATVALQLQGALSQNMAFPNATTVATAIAGAEGNAGLQTAVGAAAASTIDSNCNSGSSNQQVCSGFAAAQAATVAAGCSPGSANYQQCLGAQVLSYYGSNSTAACTCP